MGFMVCHSGVVEVPERVDSGPSGLSTISRIQSIAHLNIGHLQLNPPCFMLCFLMILGFLYPNLIITKEQNFKKKKILSLEQSAYTTTIGRG